MAVHGPPKDHESMQYFECMSSAALPTLDAVGFALSGITTTVAANTMNEKDDPTTPEIERGTPPAATATFGVITAIAAGSAIYGYINAARCAHAQQQLAVRIEAANLEQAALRDNLKNIQAVQQQGCTYDTQCKGERICVQGQCVAPEPTASPEQVMPAESAPAAQESGIGDPIDASHNNAAAETTPSTSEPGPTAPATPASASDPP